ncbi:12137_t:CDS:2, partial [Dentiscutata heterogama]
MGSKTSKITSQDQAILDLKIQRDKLKQYQKKLQVISDKETEIAKKALHNGNKRGALLALKKKRYQEQLLKKTDTQLLNLEELTQTIEFALVEKDVLSGLELGNNILNEIHKEMSIEKVEKLMEDTADAIAYQNLELEFPKIPTTPLHIADVENEVQSTSKQKVKSETVQKENKKLEVTLLQTFFPIHPYL